jgi:hypothetical protein
METVLEGIKELKPNQQICECGEIFKSKKPGLCPKCKAKEKELTAIVYDPKNDYNPRRDNFNIGEPYPLPDKGLPEGRVILPNYRTVYY